MNRHERRSDLARYRRETSGALLTYLVEPDDAALTEVPLLQQATRHWLDALSTRVRSCIVCSAWIVDGQDVGALLLTTPDIIKPTSAGTAAVCKACWAADLPMQALERAAEHVLQKVIPNGRFESMETRR
jgi:hypothetical protein